MEKHLTKEFLLNSYKKQIKEAEKEDRNSRFAFIRDNWLRHNDSKEIFTIYPIWMYHLEGISGGHKYYAIYIFAEIFKFCFFNKGTISSNELKVHLHSMARNTFRKNINLLKELKYIFEEKKNNEIIYSINFDGLLPKIEEFVISYNN